MTLTELLQRAEKFAVDNSPTILTTIGVTGTLTTAYLTGKASFKATRLIQEEQFRLNLHNKSHELEPREKAQLVWKVYLLPVGTGAFTIAAIVCANRIGNRRAAAMAAAYTISEKAFSEYKEKVIEKLGEKKEQTYRDEIAQDRVDRDPVGKTQVVITGGGEVLCYDVYTGRYFLSSMETLKKAMNDVNLQIINHNYATLNDFYVALGLANTKIGEEVGWSLERPLEIEYSTTMSDDDRPCIAVDYIVVPIRGFCRVQ